MAKLHYCRVDGKRLKIVSGDVHPTITSGVGGVGAYVVEFGSSVEAFVGTGHGYGETCGSMNVLLTAEIDTQNPRRVCVHTFAIHFGMSAQDADFSFVVALSG